MYVDTLSQKDFEGPGKPVQWAWGEKVLTGQGWLRLRLESIPLAPPATALLWLDMEDKDRLDGVARLSLSPRLLTRRVFSDLSNILASKQCL